jgi:hypothetical protein
MTKKIIFFCLCSFLTLSCFASPPDVCGKATPTEPGFCKDFKDAVYCYCKNVYHLPEQNCQDMEKVFKLMTSPFGGSTDKACKHTWSDVQACIDGWYCYRNGGTVPKNDPKGLLCNGTGVKCSI